MNKKERKEVHPVNFETFKNYLAASIAQIDPSFPEIEHQHEYFACFGSLAAIASEKDGLALRLEGDTLNITSISLLKEKRGVTDGNGRTIAERIIAAVVASARRTHIKRVCAFRVADTAVKFWTRNGFTPGVTEFDEKHKNYYYTGTASV